MKKIFFLAVMLFAPLVCVADSDVCTSEDSCKDLPACERLGYKRNMYCPEGHITCPFDTSYIWCKTYGCEMGGFLDVDSEKVAQKKAQGYVCKKVKFHGLTCSECDTIDSKCKYDNSNKGEGTLVGEKCGNDKYQECESNCAQKDRTAEILNIQGAVPIRKICTACMLDEIISTNFTCAESYVKVEDENGIEVEDGSGNGLKKYTCAPAGCPEGYEASGNLDCSSKKYEQGWRYETNGVSGGVTCSRCVPKSCPIGMKENVESCPNEVGYLYILNGYAGDSACGYCESLRCADPYTEELQSINDCPALSNVSWSADKAWTFEHSKQQAGDKLCGLCVPKKCENNEYSKSYQNLKDCPNERGYEFKYDTSHFYGDKYCGKCVEKTCSVGSTDLKIEDCVAEYGSTFGTKVVQTNEYAGKNRCKKCECDDSVCPWNAMEIGAGGEGIDICCGGLRYKACERKTSCEGDAVASIDNAKDVTTCMACGITYRKVNVCNDGFKIKNNRCVKMTCSDWNLKDLASECSAGYTGVASDEHPGCYKCKVKTCADWGKENNDVWYNADTECGDGYTKIPVGQVNVGGTMTDCVKCNCTTKEGYIEVPSEDDIPSEVIVSEKFKSCNKYQYCAGNCTTGWIKDGCRCVPEDCNGYSLVSGLKQAQGSVWKDSSGALKYEICETAGQKRYKFLGCSDEYSDVTCNSDIGEYAVGTTKGTYNCYKCLCDISSVSECRWDASNMGDGKGKTLCCNGSTYKGCERDDTKCDYTLTEKPQNALEIDTCTACKTTYYKVKSCKTGYTGEKCSSCDTSNGYGLCGGTCALKPSCGEHGTPVCSTTGWVCSCQAGYTGSSCESCDEAMGYSLCHGLCMKKPSCQHGSEVCDDEGWRCSCDSCYAGDVCHVCAQGCRDFGQGCVSDQDCSGHGKYNGTVCECDDCYTGENCSEEDEVYCKDGMPKTCGSEGYSKECKQSCQLCEPVSPKVVTVQGEELDCFNVTEKTCRYFCGKTTMSTGEVSVETTTIKCDAIKEGENIYEVGGAIYSWLKDTANGSTVSVPNGCGKTCYFDDVNCSAGEKLSEEEKTEREHDGYVCSQSGYTPAGSLCYNCVSDKCKDDLVRKGDVSAKEAQGFACTEKTGVLTAKGTQCYECLDDKCEEGDLWSEKMIDYHFDDDFTSINGIYGTVAGHYCYKVSGERRTCVESTVNKLFTNPGDCLDMVSNMRDFGGYPEDTAYTEKSGKFYSPVAACHQCISLPGQGQVKLSWYPACREAFDEAGNSLRKYWERPQNNAMEYQPGANCCKTGYDNNGDEIYNTKDIIISSKKLGAENSNAETCYWLNAKCEVALVEAAYCTGEECTNRDCVSEGFIYYYENVPAHSELSGKSCTKREMVDGRCVREPVYYEDFKCNTQSHKKNEGETACICDDYSHGKAYFNTNDKCVKHYNNTHLCVLDNESDCYVQGACDESRGYYSYDREAACLAAFNEINRTCIIDSAIQCLKNGGCVGEYYNTENSCENASTNQGHKCKKVTYCDSDEDRPDICDKIDSDDLICWTKGACDSNQGYYDDADSCEEGLTCEFDTEVQCYVSVECDVQQHHYTEEVDCVTANSGQACQEKVINTPARNVVCFVPKGCDNQKGYYDTCPSGASCQTDANGCYVVEQCATGYFDISSDIATVISYGNTSKFNIRVGTNVKSLTCGHANGCVADALSEDEFSQYDTNYFEGYNVHTAAGYTCMNVKCADGKYSTCTDNEVLVNTKVISKIGLTCGECQL